MKKILASVFLATILLTGQTAHAQVKTQQEIRQELITLLTSLIAQLQQQLADAIAQIQAQNVASQLQPASLPTIQQQTTQPEPQQTTQTTQTSIDKPVVKSQNIPMKELKITTLVKQNGNEATYTSDEVNIILSQGEADVYMQGQLFVDNVSQKDWKIRYSSPQLPEVAGSGGGLGVGLNQVGTYTFDFVSWQKKDKSDEITKTITVNVVE